MSRRAGARLELASDIGLADLLRAKKYSTGLSDQLAEILGLHSVDLPDQARGQGTEVQESVIDESAIDSPPEVADTSEEAPGKWKPIPWWRPAAVEFFDGETQEESDESPSPPESEFLEVERLRLGPLPGHGQPTRPEISPWSRLWPRLAQGLGQELARRELDIPELTQQWARRELADPLPRLKAASSVSALVILTDPAPRLSPFIADFWRFRRRLRHQLGKGALRSLEMTHDLLEGLGTPRLRAGDVILAFSDLGFYDSPSVQESWLRLGRRLRRVGAHLNALTPCPSSRWNDEVAAIWHAVDFSALPAIRRQNPSEVELRSRAERLMTLLSPAVRLEVGLIRAIRQLLAAEDADLGTELDVWWAPDMVRDGLVAKLASDSVANRRRKFLQLPEEIRSGVARLLREWHAPVAREIWFEEILGLLSIGAVPRSFLNDEEIEEIAEFLRCAGRALENSEEWGRYEQSIAHWTRRSSLRLPLSVFEDETYGKALSSAYLAATRHDPEAELPPGWRPERPTEQGPPSRWRAWLNGESLVFYPEGDPDLGSLVVDIVVEKPQILVGASGAWTRRYDLEPGLQIPLPRPNARPEWAPNWADRAGEDHFGRWADLAVGKVVQRFRFIPPGSFVMGSPDDEAGRLDNEGPRRRVNLTRGFWLGDTPCTQELWREVMGKNPSRFKTPRRPVENISWDDTQAFFASLGKMGFVGRLPSEAQWEYACRAGTSTSTYAGELEILGERNAPILDSIAWYGGNSGEGFELAKGFDSTDWQEKQYDHDEAGTREVATKQPNPWGLFDMLGNVDEWCQDWYADEYSGEDTIDPAGPTMGEYRVSRGGSWLYCARYVRAAARDWWQPSNRDPYLGFRLSRGQAPDEAAEPQQDGPADGGEPGEGRSGGPQASRIVLLGSDVERVQLRAFERPEWASAAGRDRFGLWASFEVEGVGQRLRWIPPGRFLMGSPENEAGRWEDEGPQHLVALTDGYWLADSPCTQELWQVVTGENPSEFQTAQRPVENVSWEDCQRFCESLGAQVDGLDPRLPSEAEWEYACRAGTKTATYVGDLEIRGERDAPILDDIAWYGGNSGHGFELEAGRDSTGWHGKQYPHKRAGTREIKGKAPNPWGLYDMLGNVWEWCEDWYGNYEDNAAMNPRGPGMGETRVSRGGSWVNGARGVRAAARDWWQPSARYPNLGFRLSRGQVPAGPAEPGGRPGGPALEPGEGRSGGSDEDGRPPVKRTTS